jgi:formylglycine-generating enzyme required for sulfatase activity
VSAFDILFWFLILMLGVVAFAVESGLATRHRKAVFTSMFSLVAAAGYLMVGGEDRVTVRLAGASGVEATVQNPGLPRLLLGDGQRGPQAADLALVEAATAERRDRLMLNRAPFTDCDVCPSLIPVPQGTFSMGSPKNEDGRSPTEGPVSVTIPEPIAVGRYEVTRDQFAAFVNDSKDEVSQGCLVNGQRSSNANWQRPGFEQGGNHPVVCIGWRDAKAYVGWLSKKTSKKYRLLSEAEWEYAARAGAQTPFWSGGPLGSSHANYNRSRDGTIPIGFTSSNQFGLHDVHGNAWEMVEDCWNPDLSFNPGDGRATQLRGDCSLRVIKGGGWDSKASQSRAGARSTIGSSGAANTVGFRVARVLE